MKPLAQPELGAAFIRLHGELLAVCDTIEAIADSLPDNIDRLTCRTIAASLAGILDRTQRTEEQTLFPVLLKLWPDLPGLVGTIDRLKSEHNTDLCFAEEIEEVLMSYADGKPTLSPEATGYMFRGFFECVRRHVAFEHDLLAPLLALPVRLN